MKYWIQRLWWRTDTRAFALRISEALREIAILWLVFSILDEVVANRVTARWIVVNMAASVVVWMLGMYIEVEEEATRR